MILATLPFFPTGLADTLSGQFDWWFAGFLFAMQLCAVAELVRYIRKARSGHDSP